MLSRVSAVLAVLLGAVVLAGTGCDAGGEGARCNPFLSHNDCNDGLVCSGPGTSYPIAACPENYCCPVNVTPSDNAYCQPGCAGGGVVEASTGDDGGEDGSSEGGGEASTGDAPAEGSSSHDAAPDAPADSSSVPDSGDGGGTSDGSGDTGAPVEGGAEAGDSGGAG